MKKTIKDSITTVKQLLLNKYVATSFRNNSFKEQYDELLAQKNRTTFLLRATVLVFNTVGPRSKPIQRHFLYISLIQTWNTHPSQQMAPQRIHPQ